MDEKEWERLDGIARDGWVRTARYLLIFIGVSYLFLGLVMALGFMLNADTLAAGDGQLPSWFFSLTGGFGGCCSGAFGIFNFVAASGLSNGRKWAWYLGLVLGAMYIPSGCLPLGALIVFGLMRDSTRARFQS